MEMDADEVSAPAGTHGFPSPTTRLAISSLGRYMSTSYTRVSTMPTAEPTWRVTANVGVNSQNLLQANSLVLVHVCSNLGTFSKRSTSV